MKQLSKAEKKYLDEERKGNLIEDECILIDHSCFSEIVNASKESCKGKVMGDGSNEWEDGHKFTKSENNRRMEMLRLYLLLSNIPYNSDNGSIIAFNVHESMNFLENINRILRYLSIGSYWHTLRGERDSVLLDSANGKPSIKKGIQTERNFG